MRGLVAFFVQSLQLKYIFAFRAADGPLLSREPHPSNQASDIIGSGVRNQFLTASNLQAGIPTNCK